MRKASELEQRLNDAIDLAKKQDRRTLKVSVAAATELSLDLKMLRVELEAVTRERNEAWYGDEARRGR